MTQFKKVSCPYFLHKANQTHAEENPRRVTLNVFFSEESSVEEKGKCFSIYAGNTNLATSLQQVIVRAKEETEHMNLIIPAAAAWTG